MGLKELGLIVDTTVFIRSERERKAVDLNKWRHFESFHISVITLSELMHGVHRAKSKKIENKRLKYVQRIFSSLEILPFDEAVAHQYARLWAQLEAAGKKGQAHDMMIAATAICHGHAVLTADSDFMRMPGLRVEIFGSD